MKALWIDNSMTPEQEKPTFVGLLRANDPKWGRFFNSKDGEYTAFMGVFADHASILMEFGHL